MVLDIIQMAHFLKMIYKKKYFKTLFIYVFLNSSPDSSLNSIFVLSSQNKGAGSHFPETIWGHILAPYGKM